jgi:creatinine amidohydrolase
MMKRYAGKAWNQCFLPRLTRFDIERLPKDKAVVVLPVGAVEQHGPHLPVFTDTLIGEACLTEAFERLPHDSGIWLLPPLSYGKSTEHLGHPGTITLQAHTLMLVLRDIADSLQRSGFRKLVLFSTHGGNVDLLNMMAREIRIATGMAVFRLDPGAMQLGEGLLTPLERQVGIHGGDSETSQVLAIQKDWVHMDKAPSEIPNFPSSSALAFRSKAFAWIMDDLSATGIAGDATAATEEKGRQLLEAAGEKIAEALLEMAAFDMSSLRDARQPAAP